MESTGTKYTRYLIADLQQGICHDQGSQPLLFYHVHL